LVTEYNITMDVGITDYAPDSNFNGYEEALAGYYYVNGNYYRFRYLFKPTTDFTYDSYTVDVVYVANLYNGECSSYSPILYVGKMNGSWSEATATWNNAPVGEAQTVQGSVVSGSFVVFYISIPPVYWSTIGSYGGFLSETSTDHYVRIRTEDNIMYTPSIYVYQAENISGNLSGEQSANSTAHLYWYDSISSTARRFTCFTIKDSAGNIIKDNISGNYNSTIHTYITQTNKTTKEYRLYTKYKRLDNTVIYSQNYKSISVTIKNIPTGVSMTGGNDSFYLSWNVVNEADGYRVIYWKDPNNKITVDINNKNTNYYSPSGLTTGTYYAQVCAYYGASFGYSDYSSQVSADVLNIPQNLSVTGGSNSISVSWSACSDASGYYVKYQKDGGSPQTTYTTNTYITITNLVSGQYTVQVCANYGTLGNSEYSNAQNAYVKNIPTGIQVIGGNRQFTVKWNSMSGASYYKVRYYRSGENPTETNNISNTSITISNIKSGTYYAAVQAYYSDYGGWSEYSSYYSCTVTCNPPANVDATGQERKAIISWNACNPTPTTYEVYRYVGGQYTLIGNSSSTSFEYSNILSGLYTFCVKAVYNDESSNYSSTTSCSVTASPPSSIGLFKDNSAPGVVKIGNSSGTFSDPGQWIPPNAPSGPDKYYIYCAQSSNGPFVKVGETTNRNYQESGLAGTSANPRTYYYKLSSYYNSPAEESSQSSTYSITIDNNPGGTMLVFNNSFYYADGELIYIPSGATLTADFFDDGTNYLYVTVTDKEDDRLFGYNYKFYKSSSQLSSEKYAYIGRVQKSGSYIDIVCDSYYNRISDIGTSEKPFYVSGDFYFLNGSIKVKLPDNDTYYNVVLTNDSRLSDARTPLAHAYTHHASGSDQIYFASLKRSSIDSTTHDNFVDAPHIDATTKTYIPTADQKAALVGTSGIPSSTNKYVTDSDYRLSNARTPLAHASTHHDGGSDLVYFSSLRRSSADSTTHDNFVGAPHIDATTKTYIPSSGEKAALAGSYGTPGSTNKYVTQTDTRYTHTLEKSVTRQALTDLSIGGGFSSSPSSTTNNTWVSRASFSVSPSGSGTAALLIIGYATIWSGGTDRLITLALGTSTSNLFDNDSERAYQCGSYAETVPIFSYAQVTAGSSTTIYLYYKSSVSGSQVTIYRHNIKIIDLGRV